MFFKSKENLFLFIVFLFGAFLIFSQDIKAADGSGICTLSPSQVIENTDTTLTFTFTAAETMDGGAITIEIRGGWSAPQGTSGTAGYTIATSTGTIGTLTFSGQTITVPITSLSNTQTITVVYGSGGGDSEARVQDIRDRGGLVSFTVSSKVTVGGTLTNVSSSPTIVVAVRPVFDDIPPVSSLIAPADGEIITTSNYTIEGTAFDTGGSSPAWVKVGINDVWYEVDVIGQSFSTWEYQWIDISEGIYMIKTKSADWIGNTEIPEEGITVTVSFEVLVEEEEEEVEEPVEEEEEVEEEVEEEIEEEKPISEMTITELKAKIIEIQQQIIALITQLIELFQQRISAE